MRKNAKKQGKSGKMTFSLNNRNKPRKKIN